MRDLKIDTGYYYAQAQLWSEENPDAFAGIHSSYGVCLIMDEASGIPAPIYSVSEGFFSEPTNDVIGSVSLTPDVTQDHSTIVSTPRNLTGTRSK